MRFLGGLVGLMLSLSATAQSPIYNYLDADYVEAENKAGDEATGFGVTLSLPFPNSNNFIYGRYSTVDFETALGDVEVERLRGGLGFASNVRGNASLYTLFTYEKVDTQGSGKDDGFGSELGLRLELGQYFELGAAARYLDLDQAGNDLGFEAQLVAKLTDGFGIYVAYEDLYENTELRLGIRLTTTD